ncbi:MAG: DUF4271 domain-containing protein [Candidatus Symbiothrix sp.]|jgi:hypothetical protein|nr:DUF4271 domain-containing protein [Candidatus Symbiothrix sp.]
MRTEELLSEWPATQNGGFLLFLLCFFLTASLLKGGRKLIASMLYSLFSNNNRQSIFSNTVNNELISKLLLCLQTIVLMSVILSLVIMSQIRLPMDPMAHWLEILGISSLAILAFILYQYITTSIVGWVFLDKDDIQIWNSNYFSILSLSGLVLFVPALCMFFFPEAYYYGFYFTLCYMIFVEGLIALKIYKIFFRQKSGFIYFILYLCTRKLVPLYLLYRALIYFIR